MNDYENKDELQIRYSNELYKPCVKLLIHSSNKNKKYNEKLTWSTQNYTMPGGSAVT